MLCVGRETRGKGNNGASTIARNDVAMLSRCCRDAVAKQKKKSNDEKKTSLSPVQSSPRKAAGSRRAALPKQARGSESFERRGEGVWGARKKRELRSFSFLQERTKRRRKKSECLSFSASHTHAETKTFPFSTSSLFLDLPVFLPGRRLISRTFAALSVFADARNKNSKETSSSKKKLRKLMMFSTLFVSVSSSTLLLPPLLFLSAFLTLSLRIFFSILFCNCLSRRGRSCLQKQSECERVLIFM